MTRACPPQDHLALLRRTGLAALQRRARRARARTGGPLLADLQRARLRPGRPDGAGGRAVPPGWRREAARPSRIV